MLPSDRIDNDRRTVDWNSFRVLFWCVLVMAVGFAYWPGLGGPFLLDDFGSLSELGSRGGVVDWGSFRDFVFGGNAGPTGRPLALLTFLIDAQNWPAESWPFKRTNLVIHGLCAIALYLLVRRIHLLLNGDRSRGFLPAFIVAAIWLLHPFLVSTTLYVVQRMAQLSTLFIFLGLLGYLKGRMVLTTRPQRAYVWMTLSIGIGTLLSMLSKENGILLPSLVAIVEITLVASRKTAVGTLHRGWSLLFLALPSVVIAAYLGSKFFSATFFDVVPPRQFSLYERLLTEPRILIDYLQNWFLPKLYTTGVFQDHVIKSTSLLNPLSTLPSILFHLAVIGIAVAKRQRWPLFSFAVLFFYVSHSLESTVVNLELYFEHRNYLAAAFLFLPIVYWLDARISRDRLALIGAVFLLILGGFTRYSASIWSDFESMVMASAEKAPTSIRAQADFAKTLFNAERYEESLQVVDAAIARIPPPQPHLLVLRQMMLCNLGILTAEDFEHTAQQLARAPFDPRLNNIHLEFVTTVAAGSCPAVSVAQLRRMFEAMLQQPFNNDQRQAAYPLIQYIIGYLHAKNGNAAGALDAFNLSIDVQPSASKAMNMAAVLASEGMFENALALSGSARGLLQQESREIGGVTAIQPGDIDAFETNVRRDLDLQRGAGISDPAE